MIVSPCNAPRIPRTRLRTALMAGITLVGLMSAGQLWAFNLDDVAAKAQDLAGQKFQAPKSNLPPVFRDMKYADYQKIRFLQDKAEWAGEKTPFKLSFYHQGMHFDTPVKINEITATKVEEIKYDPERFDFGDVPHDVDSTKDLGYAGFRVLYPINKADKQDEIMTLLGASYFRVVGKGHAYGLSARGLAIDTALPSGEEFPRFTEFWVEKPQPNDKQLVIYALLDSPRATGAYRMILRPGNDSIVDVKSKVFLRDRVSRLGIAPLTSMFLFGPQQPSKVQNYRPALHDSEGLAVHAGNGEWLWRPLNNPKHLSVSRFTTDDPRGFGLMQRQRNFTDYQDLDDNYQRRPSAWIEPKGEWGEGTVDLVEIPTADETNDNIVAFWSPKDMPEPGKGFEYDYRIHFTIDEAKYQPNDLATVLQTRRSTGDVKQANLIRQPDGSIALVIDFAGANLASLPADAAVRSQVSVADNADVVENNLRYNPETKGWRLTLRVKMKDPKKSTEMRAVLVQDVPTEAAKDVSHETGKAAGHHAGKEDAKASAKHSKPLHPQNKAEQAKATQVDQAEASKAEGDKTDKTADANAKPADAAEQPAADAAPATTEKLLTETWIYQLPADE